MRSLFDGKRVSHVLSFSRPEYNQRKRERAGERISISGAQTKHSLRLDNDTLSLVEEGGQYLLKPIPNGTYDNMDEVPANEHLTMQLASQVFGIETAINALVFFPEGTPAYLTRRFDVLPGGRKASQEDFAQLGEKSEEKDGKNYKYDLSYEEIAGLMKKYVNAYPVEIEKFFRLLLFNYFIQNGDAHLKNFSLKRNEQFGDYTLAPAYDLMNTRIHLPRESDLALSLFKGDFETEGFKINGKYCRDDFVELGERIGMREARIVQVINAFDNASIDRIRDLAVRSFLPAELKERYVSLAEERLMRFQYSYKEDQTR